ncbi:hypothetical protein LTR05_006765 [Lithohypha guttulata]|uniref:Ubiquitin 3 binding protein But2 C-terminal domain-containing protein n=1 Tax=Lithohypha guttulata TaxID=1690604 RepID=A0AAN7Y9E1_9EURO|nr:hypothetical protein LTR05_006765 [Lithohypha guttulata]
MKSIILLAASAVTTIAIPLQLRADTSQCPFYLPDGNYEFPHLIVPTNKSDIALGNSYFADVSPNNCETIFNFDIPSSRTNQQCSVYFTFPRHDQLVTSDFKWNGNNTNTEGPGSLQLVQYAYNTGATETTTGNTKPPLGPDPPVTLNGVAPGSAYKAWTGSCGTSGVMSWGLSSTDSSLVYFQDWNPCAIGLWVVYEVQPQSQPQQPSCGQCPDSKKSNHAAWMQAYTGAAKMDMAAAMGAMA